MDDASGMDDMDGESEVYMACILQGHRLGIAYYDCLTQKLSVLEVWVGDENFDCVQILKHQVQPTVIYTSTKMEETFLAVLRKNVSGDAKEIEVKTLRSSVFSYEQTWHRFVNCKLLDMTNLKICVIKRLLWKLVRNLIWILSEILNWDFRLVFVQVNGMTDNLSVKERIYHLKSMINMDSEMQVRAAGSLLKVLQDEMLIDPVSSTQCETDVLKIHSISQHSVDKFLTLDVTVYGTLQIFQTDKHPSYMGIGKAKEGFSLFGMFADKCVTLMGRRLLRSWFLRPIIDLHVLNGRLTFISVFSKLDEIVSAFRQSLKNAKDVPKLLKRMFSPSFVSVSNDWQQLLKTINSFIHLWEIMEVGTGQNKQILQKLQIIQKFMSINMEELFMLNDLITRAVDFDQTCGENSKTFIAKGVCKELDELKHIYDGLPDFLEQVASAELERLPNQDFCRYNGSVVYLPQIGYLMCFHGKRLAEEALLRLSDFEFMFASGTSGNEEFFYRTSKTKELDEMLGDILHKILDMEREILRSLELRIARSSGLLVEASQLVAELDCLLSLTLVAKEYEYVRPTLTCEEVLQIKNGRHPVQELLLNTFVPNDTESSFHKGWINIITGPNYSGKSVYVKQVALIVFLSHIGSFVPAENAMIGIVDRIFCASACNHTVTLPESTFMMDLQQVSSMIRNSTRKSLCILDEFGKGTLTTDGIGILCSTLTYFSQCEQPPRVFACTHFSEVFDERFLPKVENISYYTMSILQRKNSVKNEQDIIFLYRLISGQALPSYGLHCAELSGVPENVLKRASTIVSLILNGNPIDRISNDIVNLKDANYKVLIEKLLNFDCKHGDVKSFLHDMMSLKL